ncbi:hypothetical protein RJ640_015454 [Escallonia rubra]|uniref:Uncharacterized protein n=1 Tax=Escallonia rubra TaxID=112253 RepID=A0AA88U5X0_9ASTE|nr:hypothetical protein RJ640_015454 [Escallonia rubra]
MEKAQAEKQGRAAKGNKQQRPVWDCGSSLYDSFELKSFERQLDSAITSSRTLSMPHLSNRQPRPPPQQPQSPPKKSSKISRSLQKLLRFVFRPKQQSNTAIFSRARAFTRRVFCGLRQVRWRAIHDTRGTKDCGRVSLVRFILREKNDPLGRNGKTEVELYHGNLDYRNVLPCQQRRTITLQVPKQQLEQGEEEQTKNQEGLESTKWPVSKECGNETANGEQERKASSSHAWKREGTTFLQSVNP